MKKMAWALLLVSTATTAEPFTWGDSDGRAHLSDQASVGQSKAQAVPTPQVTTTAQVPKIGMTAEQRQQKCADTKGSRDLLMALHSGFDSPEMQPVRDEIAAELRQYCD